MKGFFVTGTDTGVGKTIVSCGLAALFKERKMDVGVFKPFLSGISRNHPESDTALLKQMSQTFLSDEEITPFEFKEPLAPYVAGKLEGKAIKMEEVLSHWERMREKHDCFIVEGAGGISVPLGEDFLVSHVIKALELPIIIVARPNLGTINHTFLTVQYAKSMGLSIAGIVINGISHSPDLDEKTNPDIIEDLCGVPVLGVTPKLEDITKESVQKMVTDHIDVSLLINRMGAGR
ncbi:dethiobiotin synthase [Bacillus atrophaeus]|uniref:dethiobiotin synthase n=1 Tax=Bacillus atrophaeus TaxID=1452 RepID=UPI00227F771C|nr:dethiobiotin synthase [Bacillus atrophaeus]MCY8498222.1 dethiobiotin synthase [Bacillus atrophaeus]MCY8813443.1 dethiobiotin synthase [Bacillus atrophaeus]MCY8820484.1 dethiobiotin synthase [Bacillus atrophaeus]MCY8829523.1 dethiobiotin synthase [Bacillus atrophaeus]MCY8832479.1 dethiobiotin synthase [Bacillus atrophaeus]